MVYARIKVYPYGQERIIEFETLSDQMKTELGRQRKPLIECPHWSPGQITLRRGCTACEAERTEFEKYDKALEKGIRSWVDMHNPGTNVDIDISIVTPHKRYSDGSSTCGKCDICTEGK